MKQKEGLKRLKEGFKRFIVNVEIAEGVYGTAILADEYAKNEPLENEIVSCLDDTYTYNFIVWAKNSIHAKQIAEKMRQDILNGKINTPSQDCEQS